MTPGEVAWRAWAGNDVAMLSFADHDEWERQSWEDAGIAVLRMPSNTWTGNVPTTVLPMMGIVDSNTSTWREAS